MNKGICKLYGANTTLKESHIVPKSIYKWLKDTSATPYMRNLTNPNIRSQDGVKMYLLCENCEQRFSIYEKWFKEKIFLPANEIEVEVYKPLTFDYDERLFYFINSVWWRAIHFFSKDEELQKSKYWDLIWSCEEELREFLLTYKYPLNFDRMYLLPMGYVMHAPPELKRLNAFLTRSIRPFIMFDDEACYFSLKLPCLWFFGNFAGLDNAAMGKTKINPSGGKFNSEGLVTREPHISSFMQQQIHAFHKRAEEISANQSQVIVKDILKNQERFAQSKSAEALHLDNLRDNPENDK
jgi:hypothetical protein